MFKKKIPSSEEVARYGYIAMMKGKRIAIHGLMNNILVFLTRLTPRFILAKIVKTMQGK
jgi:uncharacterized protein